MVRQGVEKGVLMSVMRSRQKPPPKPPQTLITAKQAGTILTLSASTLLSGKSGTHVLSQVRLGDGERARVRFILEEVEALKSEWISVARAQRDRLLSYYRR